MSRRWRCSCSGRRARCSAAGGGGGGGGGGGDARAQASLVGLWEGAPRGAGWRLPLLLLLGRGLLPPPLLAEVERTAGLPSAGDADGGADGSADGAASARAAPPLPPSLGSRFLRSLPKVLWQLGASKPQLSLAILATLLAFCRAGGASPPPPTTTTTATARAPPTAPPRTRTRRW